MGRKARYSILFEAGDRDEIRKKADSAGMSVSSYIRNTLRGAQLMQRPQADVPQLIIEMRRSGESLRKLLEMAYSMPDGYEDSIRNALEENRRAEQMISDAYGMRCP